MDKHKKEALDFTEKSLQLVSTMLSDDYKTGYKEGIEHYLKDKSKNSVVKPKKIEPERHEHFTPDGTSLGHLNEYEHHDLRVQICNTKSPGYYFIDNMGDKIRFDEDGRYLDDFNAYELINNLLMELM
jgi:hypothetical protein